MRSWMIGVLVGLLLITRLVSVPAAGWLPLLVMAAVCCAVTGVPVLRGLGGCCCGFALALCAVYDLQQHRLPAQCEGLDLQLEGRVVSLPRRSSMPSGDVRQRFEFEVSELRPLTCRGPRKLLLSFYGKDTIEPGSRWSLRVQLKRPWGLANPGSFNLQSWYASTGIDGTGSVKIPGSQPLSSASGLSTLHHRLRARVSERLRSSSLPATSRAILQAITVADRSGIDHALWSLLQHYGVNHLLVISGLHIGMVALPGYWLGAALQRLCWGLGLVRFAALLPPLMALLFGAFYAALAGFSLSTLRALAMLACLSVAAMTGRLSRPGHCLLLAALILLISDPLVSLGSGFWLSFGAVSALLGLAAWRPAGSRLGQLCGAHVFMSLAMVPLGAWWFGGVSQVSAVANLLLVPLVSVFVVPMSLLGLLASLGGSGLDLALWQLAVRPLEILLGPAVSIAEQHADILYQHVSGDIFELALAALAIALLLPRRSPPLRWLALFCLLPLLIPAAPLTATLTATLAAARTAPLLPEKASALQVTVLDVGQGTSVLFRQGRRALLYDTGGGDPVGNNMAVSVVLPYLRYRGVTALDTLMLSHLDRDHSAGLATLLRALPVGRVMYGGGGLPSPAALPCRGGEAWQWPGGVSFQLLAPAREAGLNSNDGSCVLRVAYHGYSLLLPGDIGADREKELVRYWRGELRSDWLLAAHHGSLSSSSLVWLKTVQPRLTIVSAGYRNRFGHPHPQVLQRLRSAGIEVLQTARGGALEFEIGDGRPSFTQYRQLARRFWM